MQLVSQTNQCVCHSPGPAGAGTTGAGSSMRGSQTDPMQGRHWGPDDVIWPVGCIFDTPAVV